MEDLKEWEDHYTINEQGEIYSKFYKKIMKPQVTEDGYLWIKLHKTIGRKYGEFITEDYKQVRFKGFIHRLIAKQYIPNPDNLPEVDHIDRQKQNNKISNLRWCNRTQNQNNKSSNIANLTEEEQKKRKDELRKYKAEWARNKRKSII